MAILSLFYLIPAPFPSPLYIGRRAKSQHLLSALFSCPEMGGVVDGEQFDVMIFRVCSFDTSVLCLTFLLDLPNILIGQAMKEPDYVLCR